MSYHEDKNNSLSLNMSSPVCYLKRYIEMFQVMESQVNTKTTLKLH